MVAGGREGRTGTKFVDGKGDLRIGDRVAPVHADEPAGDVVCTNKMIINVSRLS